MRPVLRTLILCLAMLMLPLPLSACRRNRDFTPVEPPPTEEMVEEGLSTDFQCWIYVGDDEPFCVKGDKASDLLETAKKSYGRARKTDPFPDKEGKILLIFCKGGTAPEVIIPAYQLPDAEFFGVYTLFPDDTGRYGDDMITAHVHSYQLRKGSYEEILEMIR